MRRGADFGVLQLLSRAAYSRSFADRGERTEIEIWTALRASAAQFPRSTHPIFMAGRLADGISVDAAQADAARVMSELESAFPENAARARTWSASPTWFSGPSGRRSTSSWVRLRSCSWWRA